MSSGLLGEEAGLLGSINESVEEEGLILGVFLWGARCTSRGFRLLFTYTNLDPPNDMRLASVPKTVTGTLVAFAWLVGISMAIYYTVLLNCECTRLSAFGFQIALFLSTIKKTAVAYYYLHRSSV